MRILLILDAGMPWTWMSMWSGGGEHSKIRKPRFFMQPLDFPS
jgi:hypothetical protein